MSVENNPTSSYPKQAIMNASRNDYRVTLKIREGQIPEDIYGVVVMTNLVGSCNSNGLPYKSPTHQQKQEARLLPIEETASPLLVGDGAMLSIDFSQPGTAMAQSKLLIHPSTLVDEATTLQTKEGRVLARKHPLFHYYNFGILRIAFGLGPRNLVNTAIVPVRMQGDTADRVLVTVDLGRPMEVDPTTGHSVTMLGKVNNWWQANQQKRAWPFPMIQTTAHPVFDPHTHEFFTTLYFRDEASMRPDLSMTKWKKVWRILRQDHLTDALDRDELYDKEGIDERKLQRLINKEERRLNKIGEKLLDKLRMVGAEELEKAYDLVEEVFKHPSRKDRILNFLKGLINRLEQVDTGDARVWLRRWKGAKQMEEWRVVVPGEKEGDWEDISIQMSMHQMQITDRYIVLSDSVFSLALSVMLNDPFEHLPELDEKLRRLLSKATIPYLRLWLIDREELDRVPGRIISFDDDQNINLQDDPSVGDDPKKLGPHTVKAIPLPVESFVRLQSTHFSANYDTKGGKEVVLYTTDTSSACAAEWIREYDELEAFQGQPSFKSLWGMYAIGAVDIGSFSKVKLHVDPAEQKIIDNGDPVQNFYLQGNVVSNEQYYEPDTPDSKIPQARLTTLAPHTWMMGFYTFRDIVSGTHAVGEIKSIYSVCFGLDYRLLTKYIYDMYADAPNRKLPAEWVKSLSEGMQPGCLIRIDTDKVYGSTENRLITDLNLLDKKDYYQFPSDYNPRSLQFVPAQGQKEGVAWDQHGYILVTLLTCAEPHDDIEKRLYTPEIWLFDATDLGKGPVTRMYHPEMTFAATLHTAWLENPQPITQKPENYVSVEEDYESFFKEASTMRKKKVERIQEFFGEHVYPQWNDQLPDGIK
ncbi:MAG TPA: hypothetical protein DCR93_01975 [Cytophagales bacterium]|nr:hypothetical protein [Cytophagales bacterium]HAP58318.1 hypothetical protein [Cytophagales bacterium]